MNTEFYEKFNLKIELIPLKEAGQIVQGNATRTDWNLVCPNEGESEIYLIGNPPYYGSKKQSAEQKADYPFVFGNIPYSMNLNYIALWFVKGAIYIKGTRAKLAFVTTNTITQGEHVGLMFPMIFAMDLEIGFAFPRFQWDNNAKKNADVTVAVIGLRSAGNEPKFIYHDGLKIFATNINGYLADGQNIFVMSRPSPFSSLPPMIWGSMPNDGSSLLLNESERDQLISSDGRAAAYIKRFLGSKEYIGGEERFALWIDDSQVDEAMRIPQIAGRIERVRQHRQDSDRPTTRKLSAVPHKFGEIRYQPTESIFMPINSSGLREYIPIGYLDSATVASNKAFAIYEAEPWLLSLLTSRIHMTWINAVSGRMRINYQYSNKIVYNNFPVPPLSDAMKEKLTVAALRVLDVREYHCDLTLADLYDPDRMPEDLRQAHVEVDLLVDSIYAKKPYETDEQRLSDLFAMYERMIAEEAAKAPAKKNRTSRRAIAK